MAVSPLVKNTSQQTCVGVGLGVRSISIKWGRKWRSELGSSLRGKGVVRVCWCACGCMKCWWLRGHWGPLCLPWQPHQHHRVRGHVERTSIRWGEGQSGVKIGGQTGGRGKWRGQTSTPQETHVQMHAFISQFSYNIMLPTNNKRHHTWLRFSAC